jgi:DNA-binding MarR family transcriptional regulator
MDEKKTHTEQPLTDAVHKLMRSLRRKPAGQPHISRGYMRLLKFVSEHEGASSSELAELMDIRPSSLTEMLGRLELDGMLRKHRDEKDLRVVRIYLEQEGRKRLELHINGDIEPDVLSNILTEEESKTFIELCIKLSDGLEKIAVETHHDETEYDGMHTHKKYWHDHKTDRWDHDKREHCREPHRRADYERD